MNTMISVWPRRFASLAATGLLGGLMTAGVRAADAPAAAKPAAPAPAAAKPAAPAVPAPRLAGVKGVDTFKPVSIWAGKIGDGVVTAAALEIRDLNALAKANKLDPSVEDATPTLKRPPAPGKEYIILSVGLLKGRSIGRPDYVLMVGGKDYPCLAMAVDGSPYDQRQMVVRQREGQLAVRLLFEVPAGLAQATLKPALKTTLPQADVPLSFRVDLSEGPAESGGK